MKFVCFYTYIHRHMNSKCCCFVGLKCPPMFVFAGEDPDPRLSGITNYLPDNNNSIGRLLKYRLSQMNPRNTRLQSRASMWIEVDDQCDKLAVDGRIYCRLSLTDDSPVYRTNRPSLLGWFDNMLRPFTCRGEFLSREFGNSKSYTWKYPDFWRYPNFLITHGMSRVACKVGGVAQW